VYFSAPEWWPFSFALLGGAASAAFVYSRGNAKADLFEEAGFNDPDGSSPCDLTRSAYRVEVVPKLVELRWRPMMSGCVDGLILQHGSDSLADLRLEGGA
jgi:hypothetical protein